MSDEMKFDIEAYKREQAGLQILRYVTNEGPHAGEGWLIEKGQRAFGVRDNQPCWLEYTDIGVIRFARERDAVGMLWGLRSYGDDGFAGCYVSCHKWG